MSINYSIFNYLTNNDLRCQDSEKSNCVFKKYTKEDLSRLFVIRDEHSKKFIVFNSVFDYKEYWHKTPMGQKCFHEIIFGFNNQKIKFDIDISIDDCEMQSCEMQSYLPSEILIDDINCIIDQIITQFNILYGIEITYDYIIITDSSGFINGNKWKYSYHIIIHNYYVDNNIEAKKFTMRVYENLPERIQKYIDVGVNKQIQNFRLLGCSKVEANFRYKKLSEGIFHSKYIDLNYDDFIITRFEESNNILPKIVKDELHTGLKSIQKPIPDHDIDYIINWLESNHIIDDHILRGVNNNIMSFNRIKNNKNCRICNRIHENDNSLFIKMQKNRDKISLIEYCHRSPNSYNTLITDLKNNNEANDTINESKKPYLQILIDRVYSNIQSEQNGYNNDVIYKEYSEPFMEKYEIGPNTLCIKAQMGCGKTKALRDYLNDYFDDDILPYCIRFLTFRQTFAKSLLENFSDFTIYSDIIGDINQYTHGRVIIQVESLHRLVLNNTCDPIDLLILDEVESILSQFNSGLHQQFNSAFAIFQWMLLTAKKVICIDANLCDRTINVLKRMRPNHDIHLYHNKYNRESDNVYKITNNHYDWVSQMILLLSNDKKIVLPTNSLLEAKIYKQIIEDSFPNKKIQLYSSETLMSEKNEHFSNVSHYWAQLDVLIYTPTCSAGISFELEHFDYVFAHMTDASCDVETCRQMLMRVRNISSKMYYIYFPPYSSNLGNYPITIEDIIHELKFKKNEMLKNYGGGNIQFEYTISGEIIFFKTNYFYLWLENVRIENLSKNNFVERFIQFSVDCGAIIEVLPSNAEKDCIVNYSQTKKDIKHLIADNIANAKDISQEQQLDIQTRKQSQLDVSVEELQSSLKYFIKDIYNIKYVDRDFVLIYNNESVKKVFKYLSKICQYKTVEAGLIDIQRKDIDSYSIIGMNTNASIIGAHSMSIMPAYQDGFEYQNLVKYKYTYTNHFAIQEIIKICGFAFIHIFLTEPHCIPLQDIYNNIRQNLIRIEEYINLVASEIKLPKQYSNISAAIKKIKNEKNVKEFIKKIMTLINIAIYEFYGIEIKKTDDVCSLILGKIGNLFSFHSETQIIEPPTLSEDIIIAKPSILCRMLD
jgi:hypothetical protein